jgi:hypothetical protein
MDPSNGSWLGPSRELPDAVIQLSGVIPCYTVPHCSPLTHPDDDPPICLDASGRVQSRNVRGRLIQCAENSRGLSAGVVILYAAALVLRIETRGRTLTFLRFPLSLRGILRGPLDDLQNHAALVSLSCVQRFIHCARPNSRQPSRPTFTQATHSLAVQLCDTDTGAFRRSSHPPPLPSTFHPTIKSCRDLETTIAKPKSRLSFHETSSRFAVEGSLRIIQGTPL